jgi:hypothetical protein
MSADLYRLVYYSVNRVAGKTADVSTEIGNILEKSQSNNAEAGLTGALIFNSGIFAQVLEGTRAEIEATFERIQRDARHGDVQVLAFEPSPGRGFPTWSMGYVGNSRADVNVFGEIGNDTGFDAKRLEGDRIYEIMRRIALEEEVRVA